MGSRGYGVELTGKVNTKPVFIEDQLFTLSRHSIHSPSVDHKTARSVVSTNFVEINRSNVKSYFKRHMIVKAQSLLPFLAEHSLDASIANKLKNESGHYSSPSPDTLHNLCREEIYLKRSESLGLDPGDDLEIQLPDRSGGNILFK